jgi:hypothetical protein
MALRSHLFAGDTKLEAAAQSHPAHIVKGAVGPHVAKIQGALFALDGVEVAESERRSQTYGPSTAAAVLAYKKKRDIVNRSYQSSADDVVGIMTVKALDDELLASQVDPQPVDRRCERREAGGPRLAVSDQQFEAGALGRGPAPLSRPGLPRDLPG